MSVPEFCVRWLLSYVLISRLSVGCHVVTAVAMTSTIFCDMTPLRLVPDC